MNREKNYVTELLSKQGINVSKNEQLLDAFVSDDEIQDSIISIKKLQKRIMEKWKIKTRVLDFKNTSIIIPNGTEGFDYNHNFDSQFFIEKEVISYAFKGLEELGLTFDPKANSISGKLIANGSFKIQILFKVEGEEDSSELHEKSINFVINPDPKSLWKNIPSDKEAIYWKEDNRSSAMDIGDKKIVVSSKRGRSHQNVGSFRDDDFAYKHFEKTGWTVVTVADGAGSASLSRKGSELACQELINYLEEEVSDETWNQFDIEIKKFITSKDEQALINAKELGIQSLYQSVLHSHKHIKKIAEDTYDQYPEIFTNPRAKNNFDYFHSTLICAVFKKIEEKYVIITFSVGDCPIGIVNKDKTKAKLLNWLDVGEFGGGTRFVTQAEIFHSKERPPATRFNLHIEEDFSYLFLMTDGIYDAKFEVEANLEKTEKWLTFLNDLDGNNEDKIKVDFSEEHEVVEEQLNNWMDFWSKGNHDDRTLAIIY
ncbi:PP2C family serine/threonine-protein phosphatase [Aquimarina algicola]|uniref:Protein phosphatase 2C domain-containing protein n=1 Tax=Aquimarina algicola TaxID=2589995 RepID=A0A504J0L8_9FLAO|nr:PP2C family serine/threonine-protein phosphatase [Aquimarina algicola]TPN82145.1 protein phosphatase 2C domain-containing protein [Aquimarina algicola]